MNTSIHPITKALQYPRKQLKRLYNWTLGWAETKYGLPALFVLAFVEASLFPLPPDILLAALCLSKPKKAPLYALVCTFGSAFGAMLGWYIGFGFWSALGVSPECPQFEGGQMFFDALPGVDCIRFGKVETLYQQNVWVALLTAAFTIIPFKVFTIAAGVFKVPLTTLFLASLIGRGARFFLVGMLIYFFGRSIKSFIDKKFDLILLVFSFLVILGFFLIRALH